MILVIYNTLPFCPTFFDALYKIVRNISSVVIIEVSGNPNIVPVTISKILQVIVFDVTVQVIFVYRIHRTRNNGNNSKCLRKKIKLICQFFSLFNHVDINLQPLIRNYEFYRKICLT